MSEQLTLELKGIWKQFSGNAVLKDANFKLKKGEIHALVGENGAGKSTMMNITFGIIPKDKGEILIDGEVCEISNPRVAQDFGIGFVHQEIALCPDLSVTENIFMSEIKDKAKLNIGYRSLRKRAEALLAPLAPINPDALVESLTVSDQQTVEIAKALSSECKVLIMDEPTAALSQKEAEALFAIMHRLKESGISIVYISHRMAEIFEHCDRCTVLRDGVVIETMDIKDTTPEEVVRKMVGRELGDLYPEKATVDYETTKTFLEVNGLTDGAGKKFRDINFSLYEGEILGIAGLMGAGRTELAEGIAGLRATQSGNVIFNGEDMSGLASEQIIKKGLVYLTEDRKLSGLFLEMSIRDNICALDVDLVSKRKMINKRLQNEQATSFSKRLNIKSTGILQLVGTLSGGNQQKVLLSKMLTVSPKLIIVDEPTRGIDVGAKSEIYRLLRSLADEGMGVIMISSEQNEIVGVCDRVVVMYEGQQMGELKGNEINEESLIYLASGIAN